LVITLQFTKTVKAKLLIAFGVILALNIAVGVLAFRGFSQTEEALDQLSGESLTDIVAAMTLAHESSALAALAPFVSSVRVMNELENESARLSSQVDAFATFVKALPRSPAFLDDDRRGSVETLAGSLSASLLDLVNTTKQSLDIRADLAERRYSLDSRERLILAIEAQGGAPHALIDRVREALELIFVGMTSENDFTLGNTETEFSALMAQLSSQLDGHGTTGRAIDRLLHQQASTFDLHQRDAQSQQRVRFLLATIHRLSTQLSAEVASIVDTTSRAVAQRSAVADLELSRSKEIITLLGTLAVLAAAFAAFYVMTDMARYLEGVTRAMVRLAGGDRSSSVPGLNRQDELGSLARAFDVFKEASFERESLAQQVAENSRMVDAMFSNMNDGISVFDTAGKLAKWNPQFLTALALSSEDIAAGTSFDEVSQHITSVGGKAMTIEGNPMRREEMLGHRQTTPAQFEFHFDDGRIIAVRSRPMPLGGFVTTYADQTEQRGVDRQLREAQRMEGVGQLTGGIAHDFNNLLAAISGNLQLLHQELYSDEAMSARLIRAMDATERASAVTQRLLAFARQQTLQPRMTDVNGLVTSLLDLVEYSLGAGIEVATELDPDLKPTMIDPVQLESAILNLVFNSRDAMPEGGKISIRTWSETVDGEEQVRISVTDTGQGMKPAVLSRIYEPFFTTKEKGRGTGLGLSMVYGFIKQSGGEIGIDSAPERGTKVVISLPLKVDQQVLALATDISGTAARGRGESVLLVEDDLIMQDTAADMIETLGYVVTRADDAKAAMALIDARPFDLVFTDILLPEGMTGLDVAKYASAARPDMPILFTSGYAHDGPNKRMVLPGDAILIEKPYAIATLAQAIGVLIRPVA
jgi:signal transduction histidine kinase/HAMP domain-containing protein